MRLTIALVALIGAGDLRIRHCNNVEAFYTAPVLLQRPFKQTGAAATETSSTVSIPLLLHMSDNLGDGDGEGESGSKSDLMKKMMGGRTSNLKEKMGSLSPPPQMPPPPPPPPAGGAMPGGPPQTPAGAPAYSAIPPPPPPQQQTPYDANRNPIVAAQPPPPPLPPPQMQLFDANGNPVQLPPPPPQPQFFDANGNPVQFPPQPQPYGYGAAAYPAQHLPPPPPPPAQQQPKQIIGGAGTRRNPDADRIVNTSDVYMAQLKRDSTVRTMARQYGDIDGSNQVFADPEIEKIKDEVLQNPYLLEQQKKMKSMVETSDEELIIPGGGGTNPFFDDGASRGDGKQISYKAKLAERKNKAGSTSTSTSASASASATTGGTEAETEQREDAEAALPPIPPPPPLPAHLKKAIPPPPPMPTTTTTTAAVSSGGMGFPSTYAITPPEEKKTTEQKTEPARVEPVPVPGAPAVAAVEVPAASEKTEDETRRDIRTLMGLILKHRGGPGFGSGVLKGPEAERLKGTLKDVKIILRQETSDANVPGPVPAAKTADFAATDAPGVALSGSISGAIACVEGAIRMLKTASPAEQKELLPGVRAALLSAADTFAAEAGGVVPTAQPPQTAEAAAIATNDDASKTKLRKIKEELEAVSGDGKFGLKNLSESQIGSLGDALVDMREILMEELESGASTQ